MLFMAFTCRANPSDCITPAILNPFIREHLIEKSLHSAAVVCKPDSDRYKRIRRALMRPSFRALWSVLLREAEKEIGGVGSSHTAPFGAGGPARPPTRSSETTPPPFTPQSGPRATRRGTSVGVQKALFFCRGRPSY